MTNWLYRILLVALILFCFAATFRLVSDPIRLEFPQGDAEEPTNEPAADDSPWPGFFRGDLPNWLQFFAAVPIALFSYWVFRLGLLQSALLKRANSTAVYALQEAKKANEVATRAADETKRSVDAFIDTERGWLVYLTSELGSVGASMVFKNVGRVPIVIRMCKGYGLVHSEGGKRERVDFSQTGEFTHVVERGDCFTMGIAGNGKSSHPFSSMLATNWFDKAIMSDRLSYEIKVLYETMPNQFMLVEQFFTQFNERPERTIHSTSPRQTQLNESGAAELIRIWKADIPQRQS